MTAYYNEIDPYAAAWLENLIAKGLIAHGVVDHRSIVDVQPADLTGFTQCHFFAGIGGWAYAARLASWPDDRELWTGSCPCQPFSVAGKGAGQSDSRHLWPEFFRLIGAQRPAVVMGEQVAAAIGKGWLDGVQSDLEGIGYACGAAVVPACAVDAPHRRDRLWFVADCDSVSERQVDTYTGRREGGSRAREIAGLSIAMHGASANSTCELSHGRGRHAEPGRFEYPDSGSLGNGEHSRRERWLTDWSGASAALSPSPCALGDGDGNGQRSQEPFSIDGDAREKQPPIIGTSRGSAWSDAGWIIGHDGKTRRVKSGVRLLAHGISARVGQLRAYGNAIVPQVAAEIIGAYLDCAP